MMQENTIICGDCLEVMKDWPDNCVDLVLTDPPYGKGIDYDCFVDTQANIQRLIGDIMPEIQRIGRVVALTPGNSNQRLYPKPDWTMAWFYAGGANYCKWGFNCWQPIMVWGRDPKLTNMLGCWPDAFVMEETPKKLGHPCPKPIGPMKWLVNRLSSINDIVGDPLCGEGTTCIAAKMLGRRYIGIDISEKYCEIARQRLEAVDTGVPVREQKIGQMAMFPIDNDKK